MAKSVSSIVSVTGLIQSILINLIKRVESLGGNEEDVRRLANPHDAIVQKVAMIIVGKDEVGKKAIDLRKHGGWKDAPGVPVEISDFLRLRNTIHPYAFIEIDTSTRDHRPQLVFLCKNSESGQRKEACIIRANNPIFYNQLRKTLPLMMSSGQLKSQQLLGENFLWRAFLAATSTLTMTRSLFDDVIMRLESNTLGNFWTFTIKRPDWENVFEEFVPSQNSTKALPP